MSEFGQLELMNWFEHQVKNLHGRNDAPYLMAVQPSLSDQEEDEIKSWLCFPSDSNEGDTMLVGGDLSNEQTTVGLNHDDSTGLMMPGAVEAVVPSSPVVKRNDVGSVSKKNGAKAKEKKKTKENKRSRSRCDQKRRDKINEKMKELRELLPRCRKLDKASTLDKAIGYMKDLQMQVQMMSCGYDMIMQMYPQMASPQPCMPPLRMFTDINNPALQAIPANMNPAGTGRMCLQGPGMIPLAPAPPYHEPYQAPPVNLPFPHSMASAAMFPFPQSEHPSTFPFVMQGNFQM